jgi:hypothetical protein
VPEGPNQLGLNIGRNTSRRFLPSDEKFLYAWKLPDQTSAPMADRPASTEVGELSQAALQLVRLADVDNFRPIDPVCSQGFGRHGRIFAFEPAAATSLGIALRISAAVGDHIDAA